MITYLIWDAGGTLFDTYPAVVKAAREALRALDKSPPSRKRLRELFRQTTAYALQTLADTFALDEAELEARFRTSYEGIAPKYQPPFPGVVKICRYLCKQGGQNFVITHRERASLEKLLKAHQMMAYFTDYITKDDPYPRKPDPDSMRAILAEYDLEVEQGLAIGDRDLDIEAARTAGLRTCYFGADAHKVDADLDIAAYAELYRWLREQNQN